MSYLAATVLYAIALRWRWPFGPVLAIAVIAGTIKQIDVEMQKRGVW